jgi:hypothetical protein
MSSIRRDQWEPETHSTSSPPRCEQNEEFAKWWKQWVRRLQQTRANASRKAGVPAASGSNDLRTAPASDIVIRVTAR